VSAPIGALLLLEKGPENRRERMGTAEAVQALLRNILFFAEEKELVKMVFQSACEFVQRVPVERLIFRPDPSVWEII
jgi:hypothetical protein